MSAQISNSSIVSPYSSDEKSWAAFAHENALLNLTGGVGGIIAILVIWLTHKERSAWVAFHSFQSFAFQEAILILTILVAGVVWILGFP